MERSPLTAAWSSFAPPVNSSDVMPPPAFPVTVPPPPSNAPPLTGASWLLLLAYTGLGFAATIATILLFLCSCYLLRLLFPGFGGPRGPMARLRNSANDTQPTSRYTPSSTANKRPSEVLLVVNPGEEQGTCVAVRIISEADMAQTVCESDFFIAAVPDGASSSTGHVSDIPPPTLEPPAVIEMIASSTLAPISSIHRPDVAQTQAPTT